MVEGEWSWWRYILVGESRYTVLWGRVGVGGDLFWVGGAG